MLEDFATEGGLVGDVQGQVHGHDLAGADLFGCCGYASRGEEVEASDLLFVSAIIVD